MSQWTTASATLLRPDPAKRVNYTHGLVLGVDEFRQEQYYGIERRRLHNRSLHGYGTVWGLRVESADGGVPEVLVSPGVALDARGREIVVQRRMCLRLNDWLDRHRAYLQTVYGPAPAPLRLAVVIRYRECEQDRVPVPGEPCRTQEDAMQPSRVAESFELRLCLTDPAPTSPPAPPPAGLHCAPVSQPEENAVRAFGALLARLEITSDAVDFATEQILAAEVRRLATAELPCPPATYSPPTTWPELSWPYSPPGSAPRLYLPPDRACDLLREMFRVWVTEVRPQLLEREVPTAGDPGEHLVLLAELTLPVSSTWTAGTPALDESCRPYLLHTRLLQEWLLCGHHGGSRREVPARTFATLIMLDSRTVRAWVHFPPLLDIPAYAVRVVVNDAPVVLNGISTPMPDVNVFDITLGSALADAARLEVVFFADRIAERNTPARLLVDSLNDPAFSYLDRHGNELRAYVVYEDAAGDLDGQYPAPRVVALQGRPVADQSPGANQVLTWTGAAWGPAPPVGVSDHGNLTGLGDDDHPQYLPVDPTSRALVANLNAALNKVVGLASATAAGDAMPYGQSAGGDLGGTYPSPRIAFIQNQPVDVGPIAPAPGFVLTWSGNAWVPGPSGGPKPVLAPGKFDVALVASGAFLITVTAAASRIVPTGVIYNNLRAALTAPTGGDIVLNWADVPLPYRRPPSNDAPWSYVVHGTPLAPGPGGATTFEVADFRPEGIIVRVFSGERRIYGFFVSILQLGTQQL